MIFLFRSSLINYCKHYSQIENKVKSEKHVKFRFFNVQTNPTLGVSSNMGWGVFEQCLDVPDVLWG